jgi:hypothetical protein
MALSNISLLRHHRRHIAMATPLPTGTHERFDMNTVQIAGTVQKIRPFNTHHVLVHMASGANHITLTLPEDHDITLFAGEMVRVQGWLEDVPYDESFAAFIQRAGRSDLLEKYPELSAIRDVTIQRALTVITPAATQNIEDPAALDDPDNSVRLEGCIVSSWIYSRNLYVRLVVYDEHAPVIAGDGRSGLPRRKAHYVTIQFRNGMVDGRTIKLGSEECDVTPAVLHRDDRIRISGQIKGRVYVETMRKWLTRAKRADVSSTLPNCDMLLDDVKARYGQIVIEATRLIQFG